MAIGKATFQSAGQISQHLIPGAYSRIDSVKGAAGLASANNGVIMGSAKGGEPTTLLQFNTIAEAVNTLRGGELMEAVRLAFNPGNDFVPQRLFAMRVNSATVGTLDLDKSSNTMITLTSEDYGIWVNQIKVTVANGTSTGKKVTISYQSDDDEVFDNIARNSFTIQYTAAACTMTITNNSGSDQLSTSVGYFNTNPIDLSADFDTIGEMCAFINDQTDYTCTPIAGQENASPTELDAVSAQDIYTAPYTAKSSMQAMIDVINAGSARLTAAANNGANDRAVVDNVSNAYVTGGSEGSYTATQWTNALTALEAEDIQFISTPSSDSSVHASIKTHCATMSAVTGRRERQAILGSATLTGTVATDISTAISSAGTLNSKYVMFVFNGGNQYNVDGVITNFSGSYSGCMLMGMACATAINMPLTYKTLNYISLDYKLSDSQLENLIENGVCPVGYNNNGNPHCVRQVQSYQTEDLKWNEFSMAKEMLFASRDLRSYLDALFIGQPGTSLTGGVLRGAVESRLETYKELGIFITNPQTGLAWWNVQITISGDEVTVDYDAYITAPVNFIFVTNHFHELVATA